MGAREIYRGLDQMNQVKTKNLEGFSGCNQKLKRFSGQKQVISKKKVFTEILRDFPAEIKNSYVFSARKQVISKKKKKKKVFIQKIS